MSSASVADSYGSLAHQLDRPVQHPAGKVAKAVEDSRHLRNGVQPVAQVWEPQLVGRHRPEDLSRVLHLGLQAAERLDLQPH